MRVTTTAVMLSIALAGCAAAPLQVPSDTDPDPEKALPAEWPWGLTGCDYIVAWGWVEADVLEPYLPDGMVPRVGGDLASSVLLDGPVLFGADVMTCDAGRGLDGNVTPLEYGYVWAAADPPQEALQPGVDPGEHYAKWDILIPDEERRVALAARDVPVRNGSSSIEATPSGQQGRLALAGIGAIEIQAIQSGTSSPFDGSFVKMSTGAQGLTAWTAHASSGPRTTGQATITFPEDSWMAQVIGDTSLTGGFHAGTWSYDAAKIVFVNGCPCPGEDEPRTQVFA